MATGALLDSWSGHDWADGVQIEQLRELDHLAIHTRNSTYDLVVTAPAAGEVLVRGGARFPSYTRARVCGSSIGGNIVKRAGIYPGFRLELEVEGRRILTSSVASIDVEPPADEQ
jgi:hypothetical protein